MHRARYGRAVVLCVPLCVGVMVVHIVARNDNRVVVCYNSLESFTYTC